MDLKTILLLILLGGAIALLGVLVGAAGVLYVTRGAEAGPGGKVVVQLAEPIEVTLSQGGAETSSVPSPEGPRGIVKGAAVNDANGDESAAVPPDTAHTPALVKVYWDANENGFDATDILMDFGPVSSPAADYSLEWVRQIPDCYVVMIKSDANPLGGDAEAWCFQAGSPECTPGPDCEHRKDFVYP